MNRLGNKIFSSVLAGIAVAASLAACGGGGSHSASLPQTAPTSAAAAAPYTGPLVDATFKISIPGPTSSAFKRRPSYVSSATKSLKFIINSSTTVSGTATTGTLGTYNGLAWSHFDTGTLPSATCPVDGSHAGNFLCTVTLKLPPGTDNVKISACDVTGGTCAGTAPVGNILSQQVSNFNVVAASANNFNITLDANTTNMTITASSGFCAGSFTVANAGTVGTVGTTAVTFNAGYKDLAGKTVVAPGLPVLTVNGHTDDNGGAGYTDSTTHLNVKVNQAAQTFTLTQTAGTGSAAVSLTSTPNSAGDALTFNNPLSFTFTSGAAPPASFLADAEQIFNTNHAVTGGRISLFTVALGGSDTITAFSPATLASQPVTGPAHSDIDFPNDLLFDTNGDLLIANGGSGNPDFGNFSCVAAGAITTGSNNVTVLESNIDDPVYLALGTDSRVGLMNLGVTNNYPRLVEYVLNGTYSPAPVANDVPNSGAYTNLGVNQIVALPTTASNPAGTFAGVITNGTTSAGTHVVIKRPDGSSVELPSDAQVVNAFMAYDPQNNQLVLASKNSSSSKLTNFSVATLTKVGTGQPFYNDGSGNSQAVPSGPIAASSDGKIAVALGVSGPEVVIYNNNGAGARTELGRIVFDATVTAFSNDYVYGGTGAVNIVQYLRWLSSTKLLVGFSSSNGASPGFAFTSANGLYIFDTSQAATAPAPCTAGGPGSPTASFDPFGNAASGPKLTGCKQLPNGPVAGAYKP